MRIAAFLPLLALPAVWFACSSDVTDENNATSTATGVGGASSSSQGPTTSAANGGASTTSGPASSASSTTGGGTPCDDACTKVETECGFGDLCAQIMVDCSQPFADCPSQCILAASCDEIAALIAQLPSPRLTGCIAACAGGGTGGAGGGGGDCGPCVGNNCQNDVIACVGDSECGAWLMCVQSCGDAPCIADCNATHAAAAALYAPILSCTCASCSTECASIDPCGMAAAGGAGGASATGGAGGAP